MAAPAKPVVCCLPTQPCGELRCAEAAGDGECQALVQALSSLQFDPTQCGVSGYSPNLPTWEEITPTLVFVPVVTLVAVLVLWSACRGIYHHMNLRVSPTVLNHIGCCDHPYPRTPFFLIVMNWGQIVASLWTLCLFVLSTYLERLPATMRWMEVVLGVFLLCDFAVRGCRLEFGWSVLLSPAQLIDLATVPSMLLVCFQVSESIGKIHWVSLNFLRSLSAVLAFEELKKLGAIRVGSGELVHELSSMALRLLALAVCFASSILMLEVLGDLPEILEPTRIRTGMGDISFMVMVYWIVETITTVGYGDFTPKTLLARIVTILCMITGFAFLGLELESLFSIIARQKKGSGSYVKTKRKHVVLIGGGVQQADELLILAFLEELYHPSYRAQWPDLVVMVADVQGMERIREIIDLQIEWQARQQIFYLVGSPLNMADLKRCGCDVATVVFVVSDTSGKNEPSVEDKENLLRALSLKNSFPQTPLRLMLLLQESKEKAFSVGIPPHFCFAMNELKYCLFWQACRCKGWNTLLCNLMVTTETDDVDIDGLSESPWLQEYIQGVGHEVYGLLAAEEFHGLSFGSFAVRAHQSTGICIFAAQINGRIEVSPMRRLKCITATTVLFALAQDEADLLQVASRDESKDWREVFNENRRHAWTEQGPGEVARNSVNSNTGDDGTSSWPNNGGFSDGGRKSLAEPNSPGSGFLFLPPPYPDLPDPEQLDDEAGYVCMDKLEQSRSPNRAAADSDDIGDRQHSGLSEDVTRLSLFRRRPSIDSGCRRITESVGVGSVSRKSGHPNPAIAMKASKTASAARLDEASAADVRDLERKAEVIKANAQSQPFALMLDLSGEWQNIKQFLEQSRSSYLPFDLPIVVVSSAQPPKALVVDIMSNDKGFGFVRGNLNYAPDLLRAGTQECSVIVALGQESSDMMNYGAELIPMLDADVVMLQRMLHSLGLMNKSMIFEFKRTQNMRLLPSFTWMRQDVNAAVGPAPVVKNRALLPVVEEEEVDPSAPSRPSRVGRPSVRIAVEDGEYSAVPLLNFPEDPQLQMPDVLSTRESSRDVIKIPAPRWKLGLCTEEVQEPEEAEGVPSVDFYLDPRFAAGEVFTPHVLGALLAHVFYTPGVMEVMQALALPAADDIDANFPWLVRLMQSEEGKTYGELFAAYVLDDKSPALPLGVLRTVRGAASSKDADRSTKPYVWTNPSHDAVMHQDDLLYVLADREWGREAHENGRLPLSGQHDPSGSLGAGEGGGGPAAGDGTSSAGMWMAQSTCANGTRASSTSSMPSRPSELPDGLGSGSPGSPTSYSSSRSKKTSKRVSYASAWSNESPKAGNSSLIREI